MAKQIKKSRYSNNRGFFTSLLNQEVLRVDKNMADIIKEYKQSFEQKFQMPISDPVLTMKLANQLRKLQAQGHLSFNTLFKIEKKKGRKPKLL